MSVESGMAQCVLLISGMDRKIKRTPPRLAIIQQQHCPPLYLLTICTLMRQRILAHEDVHAAWRIYVERGLLFGVGVGRYVLMPDHIHVFVRMGGEVTLSRWVKGMKRHLDVSLQAIGHLPVVVPGTQLQSFWQPGSFDHLLRSTESYAQKWNYVRENPVRAGLVKQSDDWPFQGEIVVIDRA